MQYVFSLCFLPFCPSQKAVARGNYVAKKRIRMVNLATANNSNGGYLVL